MSQATDLAYAFATAYNAHDADAISALCTEDVEIWTFLEGRAEGEPYRGHAGIRGWQANEREAWERVQLSEFRARDLGGGRVLALAKVTARGRGSGLEIEAEAGWIAETREGTFFRIRTFDDPEHAREAAGLRE